MRFRKNQRERLICGSRDTDTYIEKIISLENSYYSPLWPLHEYLAYNQNAITVFFLLIQNTLPGVICC